MHLYDMNLLWKKAKFLYLSHSLFLPCLWFHFFILFFICPGLIYLYVFFRPQTVILWSRNWERCSIFKFSLVFLLMKNVYSKWMSIKFDKKNFCGRSYSLCSSVFEKFHKHVITKAWVCLKEFSWVLGCTINPFQLYFSSLLN